MKRVLAYLLIAVSKFISGPTARWIGCKPETRQRIYFANHTSMLDFAVIWAVLPKDIRDLTRPVAAKDYFEPNMIRNYLAVNIFNAILVMRDNADMSERQKQIDLMAEAMGDKYSIIIFPEGTRNLGPEIGQFKSGLYHLAIKKLNAELVPVYLDNLNRILPRGEFLPVPLLSCVSFGSPISVKEGETKDDFIKRAWEAMNNLKQL